MSTLPQEFIDLAAELIGDEFAAFADDCVLLNAAGWNNATQVATTETQTLKAIRLDYKTRDINGESVQINDYMLIAQYQLITIPVRSDSTTCTFNAEKLQIKNVTIDPAGATIIMQVRRL
jgi:hypothetical protein